MPTPYRTAQTWVDDDARYPLTANRISTMESGISDALYRPSCRAYGTLTATLASGNTTGITLNAESHDTDNMHSLVTNPGRITINTGGVYLITANVEFAPLFPTFGFRELQIFSSIQGSVGWERQTTLTASVAPALHVSTMVRMTVGEYVEMQVQQTSTNFLPITAQTDYAPQMAATLLAYF